MLSSESVQENNASSDEIHAQIMLLLTVQVAGSVLPATESFPPFQPAMWNEVVSSIWAPIKEPILYVSNTSLPPP